MTQSGNFWGESQDEPTGHTTLNRFFLTRNRKKSQEKAKLALALPENSPYKTRPLMERVGTEVAKRGGL